MASPFLLFANCLSPITPSRALLAQGVSDAQAAALFPARSPAPLCFASPTNFKRCTPCLFLIRVTRHPVSPLLNRSSPKPRRTSPIEPRIRVYAD